MPGLRDLARRTPGERAGDWASHLDDGAERSWTLAKRHTTKGGRTIPAGTVFTLFDVIAGDNRIEFKVRATRPNGNPVPIGETGGEVAHHVVINPPIYAPDGGTDAEGKPTFTRNIRAILRDLVHELIP